MSVQKCPILSAKKKKSFWREVFKDIGLFCKNNAISILHAQEMFARIFMFSMASLSLALFAGTIASSNNLSLTFTMTDITEVALFGLKFSIISWFVIYLIKSVSNYLFKCGVNNIISEIFPFYIIPFFMSGFIIWMMSIFFNFVPIALTKIECAVIYVEKQKHSNLSLNERHSVCGNVVAEKYIKQQMQEIEERAFSRGLFTRE